MSSSSSKASPAVIPLSKSASTAASEINQQQQQGVLRHSDPGRYKDLMRTLFRRLFHVDDDSLIETFPAKLHGAVPRRGTLFVTRERLYFCPHADANQRRVMIGSNMINMGDYTEQYVAEDSVKLSLRSVTAVDKEDVYLPSSSKRIRISTATGSILFRGLSDAETRDRMYDCIYKLWEQEAKSWRVFGVGLDVLAEREKTSGVPRVVENMVAELEMDDADVLAELMDETAGEGDVEQVSNLELVLDAGQDVEWSKMSVHVIGLLLKRFLSKLPSPLLPATLAMTAASASQAPSDIRAQHVRSVLTQLPECNRRLLRFLVFHWAALVASSSTDAKSSTRQLAASFAQSVSQSGDPAINPIITEVLTVVILDRTKVLC